ncbi:Na+/H+ antiporter NhaC family protein [Pseudovibrio sp. Tun.PSC04-5.I4]|uniref:Na+/H+ antiporter NhaC family protein n=1 Tax=Pseudovibrio sp. Tun.PSC04-5.I4 TaxID=1798213 RepID=UPI00088D84CE|nr:Na+/H+ antiporter NhaC family protein [Pseudovibrio sp. Tun.PSC04-5.I4]SDR35032.1 transporter, NhaC family [Pseudovibrio sp. Tun.PSC04-5.I4]
MTTLRNPRKPSVLEAFSCLAVLLIAILGGVIGYGMSIGIAMIISAAYTLLIGLRCGYSWKDIEDGINDKIKDIIDVLIIVLGIGFVIATWMFSGTIPVTIYYLLKVVDPSYIVAFAFVACSLTAIAIGTSWGTAGTVGVVMIGMGQVLDVHLPLMAGAVVSGSMFGQIFSPMSDMCNLASSVNRVSVYSTLKGTAIVVFPTAAIATVAYIFLGMSYSTGTATADTAQMFSTQIESLFNTNPVVILPLLLLLGCSLKRLPVVPSMFAAGFLAILFGYFFNGFNLIDGFNAGYNGFKLDMIPGADIAAIAPQVKSLVNRGGLDSMGWMFVLMFAAMTFIGAFTAVGCLDVIVETLFGGVKKKGSLVLASVLATLTTAITTTESYIAVIVPTELFRDKYKQFNLPRVSLSVSTLSASAIFIPLIPWGSTGIYMAGVTGTSVLSYIPFAFLCWGCAIVTVVFGYLNIGPKTDDEFDAAAESLGQEALSNEPAE